MFWTKRRAPCAKQGMSLIELSIAIGVIGVVLSGVWAAAGQMKSRVQEQKFTELLTVIVNNVRGVYAGRASVDYLNVPSEMPILTSMNVFPGDIIKKDTSSGRSVAVSPFGEFTNPSSTVYNSMYVCGWKNGSLCSFAAAPTTAVGIPFFAVESLLPKGSSCTRVVMANVNRSTIQGFVGLYINGTQITLPTTVATLNTAAACNKAASPVIVDFVYRLQM